MKSSCSAAGCGLLLLALAGPASAEGFGTRREPIPLERINPPVVAITGTKIKVAVKAKSSKDKLFASRFKTQLESELLGNDPRFKLEEQRPETLLAFNLESNSYEERKEMRQEWEVKPTENAEGKRELKEKEVTSEYKVLSRLVTFSYTVSKVATKETLFSDTVEFAFREAFRFGEGAPTPAELDGAAISTIVTNVVGKLTPTMEPIYVLLAKGSLERLSNFARGGFWSKYSDALEELEPFKKPKDEAYRQYSLGLAYEAMAYTADDALTALRFLERAAEHYNAAQDAHPEEAYFFTPFETNFVVQTHRKIMNFITKKDKPTLVIVPPPLERVNEGLTRYRILTNQNDSKLAASQAEGAKTVAEEAGADVLTNASIIEMTRDKVDEELIFDLIDEAKKCTFDLGAKGLSELTKGKVSKGVIERMKQAPCRG
jgi:hypothetical protein